MCASDLVHNHSNQFESGHHTCKRETVRPEGQNHKESRTTKSPHSSNGVWPLHKPMWWSLPCQTPLPPPKNSRIGKKLRRMSGDVKDQCVQS